MQPVKSTVRRVDRGSRNRSFASIVVRMSWSGTADVASVSQADCFRLGRGIRDEGPAATTSPPRARTERDWISPCFLRGWTVGRRGVQGRNGVGGAGSPNDAVPPAAAQRISIMRRDQDRVSAFDATARQGEQAAKAGSMRLVRPLFLPAPAAVSQGRCLGALSHPPPELVGRRYQAWGNQTRSDHFFLEARL